MRRVLWGLMFAVLGGLITSFLGGIPLAGAVVGFVVGFLMGGRGKTKHTIPTSGDAASGDAAMAGRKNDCVFCLHESAKGGFCNFFGEAISSEELVLRGGSWITPRARRNQNSCPGFELDPHMRRNWEEDYGPSR